MNGQPPSVLKTQTTRLVPLAPAAAVSVQGNGAITDAQLMPFSCTTCARRKVKCDKLLSKCSACRKGRLDCQYQEPPPRKKKRKPVEDLQDRLDRYEKLLHDHGILTKDEDKIPSNAATGTTALQDDKPMGLFGSTPDGPNLKRTGRLIQGPSNSGKTRYIDSNIWRNLQEHMELSSDEVDEDFEDQADDTLSPEPLDPASSAFFGPATPAQSLLDIHPTYDVAMKLWGLFVRNVDPITKVGKYGRPKAYSILDVSSSRFPPSCCAL